MMRSILLVIGVSGILASCKQEPVMPLDPGYSYYPLQVGAWVEYQVDSLWQDDLLGVLDSVSYRLKEHIAEEYIDGTGRKAYRVLRYQQDADGVWQVRDVWTTTADKQYAEKTEENLRRLKLSFPVRESRTWDMNIYNADQELEVAFREVDSPWSFDTLAFDSTVVVRNVLGPNAVETRNFEERYARHVGLVEKYWEETNTQFNSTTQQFVVRGFRSKMVAVGHGHQ
jgi:hypothetical protein